jgi:pilus assembly protein CpaC
VAAQPAQVQFIGKLKPTVMASGEDIEVQVSLTNQNLVGYNGSNPIVGTRAVETTLYIKSGDSAAVGGFETSNVSSAFNKDKAGDGSFAAGTTQTDPLFNLKRTKNFTKTKTQFVVFVTPQIIEDAAQGSEDLKRNFRVKVK